VNFTRTGDARVDLLPDPASLPARVTLAALAVRAVVGVVTPTVWEPVSALSAYADPDAREANLTPDQLNPQVRAL
jgi:hypothetical protein